MGSYLGKYLHLCASHHILPCDSTLMTPNEVKTNSMMAALMVPYWNLTNKSFISWPTQAASQVLSLEELLPLQWLACHSEVSFVFQAKSDFCCLCHVPYSGKLSREKTIANWWKFDFHRENFRGLLAFAIPKDGMPQISRRKLSRIVTKPWNLRSFLLQKFSAVQNTVLTWDSLKKAELIHHAC